LSLAASFFFFAAAFGGFFSFAGAFSFGAGFPFAGAFSFFGFAPFLGFVSSCFYSASGSAFFSSAAVGSSSLGLLTSFSFYSYSSAASGLADGSS
jgi:hypothetical protein